MLSRDQIERRSLLKGVSLGAGGILLAPLAQKISAAAEGRATKPRRVIFFLFDNGFKDDGAAVIGTDLVSDQTRQFSLEGHKLPLDIEPFAPFQDRMTLLHGMRAHAAVDHGGYFAALTACEGNKWVPQAESIDAAIAKAFPGVFPLLGLGIAPPGPSVAYCSSAWAAGQPVAMQCQPDMAYESLFGSIGATRNDFATRKNLLDFVSGDVKRLRGRIAGPERELLDAHLESLERLSKRDGQLSEHYENGTLNKHTPNLPAKLVSVADVAVAQCDIAAAALTAGLTNVVTISAGLCGVPGSYSGIVEGHPHGLGHGDWKGLSVYHNFLAKQAAGMLTKLQETKEGDGSMLDNTVLVFMSDSANQQHSRKGANWPFVLVGNLGGRLKAGQFLSYPVSMAVGADARHALMGVAGHANPLINALYCTLLHAIDAPRATFNRPASSTNAPALYGPLPELLTS